MTQMVKRFALVLGTALLTSCDAVFGPRGDVEIPDGLTPIELTTDTRDDTWTDPPRVTFTPVPAGIRVLVERQHLCAMIATAGSRELGGTIEVFASVSPHPAALCAAVVRGTSEYEGVVPAPRRILYRINVYESAGDGPARLIASTLIRPQ